MASDTNDIRKGSISSHASSLGMSRRRRSSHEGHVASADVRDSRNQGQSSEEDEVPDSFNNLDEVAAGPPIENPHERKRPSAEFLAEKRSHQSSTNQGLDMDSPAESDDIPDDFANLNEVAGETPVENPNEQDLYHEDFLEDEHSHEQSRQTDARHSSQDQAPQSEAQKTRSKDARASKRITEFITISYLILFAIFGTLARLGLQWLTAYPGSPIAIPELWANVAGSLIMGFLSEDRTLFKKRQAPSRSAKKEKHSPSLERSQETVTGSATDSTGREDSKDPEKGRDIAEARKAHNAVKKTIPLYIGLTTGFCGSFTSFSSFIRDVFLALANQSPAIALRRTPSSPVTRDGGYSFMAVFAILILEISLSLAALQAGAHLALALESLIPRLNLRRPLPRLVIISARFLDHGIVLIAWAAWLGTIFFTIWTPVDSWRGRVLFAIVLAPVGCIARFYASLRFNGVFGSFPLGTFVVNVVGTLVLGMCWDLQRASGACVGRLGCQVLAGVQDGFCGCLTTVSTWVVELTSLRRRHAYIYGGVSVGVSLALLVAVMGSLVWTKGVAPLACL